MIISIASSVPAEPNAKRRRLDEATLRPLPPLPAGIRILDPNNNTLTSIPEVTLPSSKVNEDDEIIFVTPAKKPHVTLVDLTEDEEKTFSSEVQIIGEGMKKEEQ